MIYSNYNKNYLDPFFDALFGKEATNFGYMPMKTDILESKDAYRLNIEIPGVKKENITLDFKDGYLTVAVKVADEEKGEFKTIRRECFVGETSRQFYLGDVEEANITASYEDGILTITAPKMKPEETKPHRIAIQ